MTDITAESQPAAAADTQAKGTEFQNDLRRKGLPPKVVKGLTAQNDLRATLGVLETFGTIALMVGLSLYFWHPLVVIPCMFILATRHQALFVLAHDAAHYRLYKSRTLNDLVGRLCGIVIGFSTRTYRVVHRLHHNHLYEKQDPDIPLNAGYPRGKAYLYKKLIADLFALNAWKTYRYFFGAPSINDNAEKANRPLDDTSPKLRAQARADRWWVVGFHVTAPLVALYFGYLLEYVVLWIVPGITMLQPILRLRAVCEHGAVTDYSSPMTASRTNLGPKWFMWLFFPHDVNYHVEHHMYPSIPFYNLKRAHRLMQEHGVFEHAEIRHVFDTLKMVVADRPQKSDTSEPRTA